MVVLQPETVPLTGKITRIGEVRTCTSFIRRAGSAELAINPPLPMDVAPGTPLTIGPCGVQQEFVQESCAVTRREGAAETFPAPGLLLVFLWVARLCRKPAR
ncbi:MAG: hypothetical protein N3C12_14500 [Candidatus Binatia bacterium]|nr:hypothetical protein [Candidatus Binatia bacterium]